MKVQLYVENADESMEYIDAYIDESKIVGTYTPSGTNDYMNILIDGQVLTVKKEQTIINFLYKKFLC